MAVRRIVRKLSSKSAMETPTERSFAITAAGSMQANKEATIVFLIFIVDPWGSVICQFIEMK
jgi:hypothetical protein